MKLLLLAGLVALLAYGYQRETQAVPATPSADLQKELAETTRQLAEARQQLAATMAGRSGTPVPKPKLPEWFAERLQERPAGLETASEKPGGPTEHGPQKHGR